MQTSVSQNVEIFLSVPLLVNVTAESEMSVTHSSQKVETEAVLIENDSEVPCCVSLQWICIGISYCLWMGLRVSVCMRVSPVFLQSTSDKAAMALLTSMTESSPSSTTLLESDVFILCLSLCPLPCIDSSLCPFCFQFSFPWMPVSIQSSHVMSSSCGSVSLWTGLLSWH